MTHDILRDLNPAQVKAAEALSGPVLILAGAGSGKTKTLTHRLANLIHHQVSPYNILAVTFTNKAAQEMRERTAKLLPSARHVPLIGTFHAICLRILRKEIGILGYDPSFVIYNTDDQKALVKKACARLSIDIKEVNPSTLLYMISGAKNELITPKQYENRAGEYMEEIAAKVYIEYQRLLKENNAVDFDDLIMLTVQIFEKYPETLHRYQDQFRYIMVDEYQDTNHAQYKLLRLLSKKYNNICVVGDDWQAIYSFRGADLQNILDFEKDYKDAKVFLLEQNYRSTQNILDVAQFVIDQNKKQKKKKLWTENKGGEKVRLHEMQDEREEALFVARSMRDMAQANRARYQDFAVLYRTNAQSRAIEEACLEYNVPYRIVGGMRFYDRREIKDILAYLSLLNNTHDMMNFERIVNVPSRGIGSSTVNRVTAYASQNDIDIIEACERSEEIPNLQASKIEALKDFAILIRELQEAEGKLTIDHFIEHVMTASSYKQGVLEKDPEGEDRYDNIQELKTVAKNYKSLQGFLENVALVSDVDSYDENANVVTLMTLHAAKGLEFEHVFVVGLEEGILPHNQSMLSQHEVDEERRLCYVGMTRAKKTLDLIYASFRTIYGQPHANGMSRFVEEIPDELLEKNVVNREKLFEVSLESDDEFVDEVFENPFSKGDEVYHAQFGNGEVVAVDDDVIEVHFKKGGKRELSIYHAPLKKLEK